MTISTLPTAPARTQAPATFITNADAMMAALPTFVTEANALAASMNASSAGGAVSIGYTFSTTTTDSDPGSGTLRLSNATQNASTVIRTDLLDTGATDWTTVLDTFDDSTNTVKGSIRLVKVSDGTKWLTFNITSAASPSGYRNFTVTNTGSSAASPFSNGDAITLSFSRAGDVGATGATGAAGVGVSGGTTHAGSFTLAAGDPYAQKVSPTSFGLACTAADATTFTKGAITSLFNASDYDYAFKDSTGVIRAFVPPWQTCAIALADNSTAAGQWTFSNCTLLGKTAQTFSATSSGPGSGKIQFISLDSDRSLFLYGDTSCYGRVFRKSTNAWAAAVLIRASIQSSAFSGIKTNVTDQALVTSCDTTTGYQAVVLSINSSTDVITVGTAASVVLAGNYSSGQWGALVATVAGTSWVHTYGRATNVSGVRAFTISGTTPTIGSETALSPANTTPGIVYAVTGGVVLTLSADATTFYSLPLTITGSSIAAGTGATTTIDAVAFKSVAVGTRWHALLKNGNLTGCVINVTSTTSTHSTAVLSTNTNQIITNCCDALVVGSTKLCVASTNASTSAYVNILTDTAGTASAGTELALPTLQNIALAALGRLSVSGNTCKFVAHPTTGPDILFTIDASGASPTLSAIFESGGTNATGNNGPYLVNSGSMTLSARDANNLTSTVGQILLGKAGSNSGSLGGFIAGSNLTSIPPINVPCNNTSTISHNIPGLTAAESWYYSQTYNLITKVEAAQP